MTRHDAALAATLVREDQAEEAGLLAYDDRLTCYLHRRWIHHCVSSPAHVNPITRHRWCRACRLPLTVAVDELRRTVAMTCPGCGAEPGPATAALLAACRASIVAAASAQRGLHAVA